MNHYCSLPGTPGMVSTAVALVTEDAIRVPNGIVLSARAENSPFARLRPKMEATIGDGNVRLESLRVVTSRVWAP